MLRPACPCQLVVQLEKREADVPHKKLHPGAPWQERAYPDVARQSSTCPYSRPSAADQKSCAGVNPIESPSPPGAKVKTLQVKRQSTYLRTRGSLKSLRSRCNNNPIKDTGCFSKIDRPLSLSSIVTSAPSG